MSLAMQTALDLVDSRMEPLSDTRIPVSDGALTCRGTDVPGLELMQVVKFTSADTVARVCDGEPMGALLNGVVLRSFWLGYEFGRAA